VQWIRDKLSWVFGESKSLILKEIIKWALLSVATLVGGWLWAAFRRIADADSPLASAPLWVRLRAVAFDFYGDPIGYSLALLKSEPGSTILALILIASYAIFFILLRRANFKLREASVERALAVQAGIGGRWSHAKTNDSGGAPWKDLCAEISRYENNILLILGANGLETFGRPGSPLYDSMQNFRGSTRVVLIDPSSDPTAGRAAALNVPIAEYRKAIAASVKRLRELNRQQYPVEWRHYDGQPNWKMIITNRTAWIQYYIPGQHVDQTPVWRFDSTEHGDGLYHLFTMEFERIWRRCGHVEIGPP
jgi:hypothetical protein